MPRPRNERPTEIVLTRDDVLRLIRERAQHPASSKELMQLLQVPPEARASFRRQLKALAAEGALVQVRGRRYGLADKMDRVVGRVQAHAGGFAFVVPERSDGPARPDVFVQAAWLKEAM